MSSSSEYSSWGESSEYSSEDGSYEPDFYSQLGSLDIVYTPEHVYMGAVLDMCEVDSIYASVVKPVTLSLGGIFQGVTVVSEDTVVKSKAYFKGGFARQQTELEVVVIEEWFAHVLSSVRAAMRSIREDGSLAVYPNPEFFEVF